MSETASPKAAREHARAQAAAAEVTNRPLLPPTRAADLPDGWDASQLVWAETLGAGDYTSHRLARGSRLRLENLEGDGCLHLLVHNALAPQERLNVADTVKVQWQAYLGAGSCLLSDMGRALLSILEDTSGRHDLFCGHSNRRSDAARFGSGENHTPTPNARDRFVLALQKHGLGRRDVAPTACFFKGVAIAPDGALHFRERAPRPGELVELRAEMDVIVSLVNAPHVLDPRSAYVATPVRVLARIAPPAHSDDPIRRSTPERERAFENVDDFYAS
jgi:hypothetical protein